MYSVDDVTRKRIAPLGTTFFCFFLVSSVSGQTARNSQPLTAVDGEKWTIRWDRSDDFNGEVVDWRKWNKNPELFGAWTWDNAANTSVADGLLTITMRRDAESAGSGRQPTPYKSGMLKSYAKGTYGYYETRLKAAPLFPGVCPSFWLYSTIDDKLVSPGAVRYSEVDIVELTQRGDRVAGNERVADLNLHAILSNGKPGLAGRDWRRPNDERYKESQANEYRTPFDPRDDFHTYGCNVGEDSITWYVDGKEIGKKSNQHWHREMNVALSLGLRPPYSHYTPKGFIPVTGQPDDGFPTSMKVDYVRVWERTPNSTAVRQSQ
jgi:beta-glucanase (GH16 family)